MDISKIKGLASKAAETVDMTKAQSGGGDFTPLAAGPARARFVGYVEKGKHSKTFKGVAKVREQASLFFEISGPKHPAREVDGVKYPNIIEIKEGKSLNEKARFFKLVQQLNYQGKAKHVAELLGDPYKCTVVHRTYKKTDGTEGVAVELYDKVKGSFTLEPPRYEIVDPENGPTGEYAALKVDEPLSPLKLFLWEHADMEQWASIFIEGEYPERKNDKGEVTAKAKSKNVLQNTIKAAANFQGSPIATLLAANGQSLDLPDSERPDLDDGEDDDDAQAAPAAQQQATPTGAAADDALSGIV